MNDRIDADQLVGAQLVGAGQEKIGKIGQVFLDDETGAPQWVTVQTGLIARSENFVPLAGARLAGEGQVQVPYGKDQVKDAPSVDVDAGHLSPAEEAALYRYYGLGAGTFGEGTDESRGWFQEGQDGGRDGYDTSGPTTDEAMTRSEERLRAATERVEAGRARLRKYIVTENQQVSVPVTREQVRVEREPITDENRAPLSTAPSSRRRSTRSSCTSSARSSRRRRSRSSGSGSASRPSSPRRPSRPTSARSASSSTRTAAPAGRSTRTGRSRR